jgi:hypothetical protein
MDAQLSKLFNLCFWILKKTGMWQDGNQSWTYFIIGYLMHFVIIDLNILGQIAYVANATNLVDLIDALGLVISYMAVLFKCINFFCRLKRIETLVESLNELVIFSADERFQERQQIKTQIAIVLKIWKVFLFSIVLACVIAALTPFVDHALPYKFYLPFDTEVVFWMVSMYLVVDSLIIGIIMMVFDMLPIIVISVAIGLIKELTHRLSQIGTRKKDDDEGSKINRAAGPSSKVSKAARVLAQKAFDDEKDLNELLKCVEIHMRTKELVVEVENIFVSGIFFQGLMSTVIMCMAAFIISVVSLE